MSATLTNDQKHQLAAIYLILAIAMYLIPLPQITLHIDLIEEVLFIVFMLLISHQGIQEIIADWGTYKTSLATLAGQVTSQVDATITTSGAANASSAPAAASVTLTVPPASGAVG